MAQSDAAAFPVRVPQEGSVATGVLRVGGVSVLTKRCPAVGRSTWELRPLRTLILRMLHLWVTFGARLTIRTLGGLSRNATVACFAVRSGQDLASVRYPVLRHWLFYFTMTFTDLCMSLTCVI